MPTVVDVPLAQVELFAGRSGDEPIGTIAVPVRDHLNAATVTSLLMTHWPVSNIDKLIIQGSILTLQRNECIQRMRGDWLLFIDDDMVWEPDAVTDLLNARDELAEMHGIEADILGGLCFRRSAPYQPTLYMRESATEGAYNFLERWDEGFVEVDATGMAFALISKACLERIAGTEMPPYEERVRRGGTPNFFRWDDRLGEDLRFCQDVKRAGGQIFVDTRIKTRHVAEVQISQADFLREVALREPEVEDARREVNDRMGLPTLSATEAREQLGW